MNCNYLVTGGAGFLGCTLVRKLLAAGNRVVVYDNFSFGRRENIAISDDRLTVVEGDINDTSLLNKVVVERDIRCVVHLAALHFIPYCNQHPCETLRVNVEGTQNLLEVCRNNRVEKILSASSAAVYPQSDLAYKESDPVGAFDIYGMSKMFTEHLINAFHQETGKPCGNLRFFNIYGPYETNPHLIPRIIEQYANRAMVIELGNLHPKRDYIYVEDMADAIIAIIGLKHQSVEVLNIGTGLEYSVVEVVEKLNAITGRNVKVESVEKNRRAVDREHLLADVSRLKSMTGWAPRHSIEEGLRKTAQFYKLI
jgi:UDP-glucose 4-epimerase